MRKCMTTKIIDGKAFAAGLREKITKQVEKAKEQSGKVPGLAVILVGEDPASQVYVRNKHKATEDAGMKSFEYKMPGNTSQKQLIDKVKELNGNPEVHGILVQLPLPKQIDEDAVINAIDPAKDVDGFHPINVGRLSLGQDAFVPCTPQGCLMLIKDVLGEKLSGMNAVVVGRSNIVGRPMARLLVQEDCTVTVVHSKTKDPQEICKKADIVVAAVGKAKIINADWIKKGAVVIDVGINRGADGKLVGDVDFETVSKLAKAITPVPGGVGPMTIACLLKNTLKSFCKIENISVVN